MLDAFLVPEIAIEAKGDGSPLALGDAAGKMLVATLAITKIVEQQALDVSIWASADGADWGIKPVAAFPQKFYHGVYQLVVDLSQHPEAKFLKAQWTVNRWGVGETKPHFSFMVKVQEQAMAGARR